MVTALDKEVNIGIYCYYYYLLFQNFLASRVSAEVIVLVFSLENNLFLIPLGNFLFLFEIQKTVLYCPFLCNVIYTYIYNFYGVPILHIWSFSVIQFLWNIIVIFNTVKSSIIYKSPVSSAYISWLLVILYCLFTFIF